jgi:hypothetical protein
MRRRGRWIGNYGKLEGKRPIERSRRRWICNIKMDLGEIV